jgi:hypothetical protein
MSISKQLFLGNSYNLPGISSPSDPTTGMRFYVDTSDSKFKSRNNTGVVTVYQPTTTKGDLVTHNGSTTVRLPIGTDGYVLRANSSTSSGIEWAVGGSGSGGGGGNSSNKFTLTASNLRTSIIENTLGSYFMFIYPKVENGGSRNFFASKSIVSVNGVSNSFNNNTSLTNSGSLSIDYNSYKGIYIRKSNTEADGDYIANTNEFFTYSEISLSGTSWTSIGIPGIVGAFSFSVSSKNGGPSATFITVKSTSSFANGNNTRLVSSPSSTSGVLEIRWLNASQIEIRKTNANDDGVYQVVDNFQSNVTTTESLAGSALTTINKQTFNYYENKSFMVSVSSLLANSPNAVFLCSKNSVTRVGSFTSFRSPGNTTGELLSMSWSSTNLLRFNKSGAGYDSQYTLSFTKLT